MIVNEAQESVGAALVDLARAAITCGQFARQWPTPSVTIWNDIASARAEAAPRTSKNANASRRSSRGRMSHENLAPATPRS